MNTYRVTYTDTFSGEPNYAWVREWSIDMPDLTHYGYDGLYNYGKACKRMERQLVKRAKRLAGLTNVLCNKERAGGCIELRPVGYNTVLMIDLDN